MRRLTAPPWMKVRRELRRRPVVEGKVDGRIPIFVERYIYQAIDRTVSGVPVTCLVVQFGGGRVTEGEPDHWRSMNLPSQALVIPRGVPTHWHYSGTVDFAGFYLLAGSDPLLQRLEARLQGRDAPLSFTDALVGAVALQLVQELQKAASADDGFMERLAGILLEQTYRVLTGSAPRGIHPRHQHFHRLQSVLNYIHGQPSADLSTAALATRADISTAHFSRIFRDAMGTSPHRYVLSARLDLARKLLAQSTLPIARIAQESGFSSQSHLTASFGAAHAVTPAQYRAHVRPAGQAATIA